MFCLRWKKASTWVAVYQGAQDSLWEAYKIISINHAGRGAYKVLEQYVLASIFIVFQAYIFASDFSLAAARVF